MRNSKDNVSENGRTPPSAQGLGASGQPHRTGTAGSPSEEVVYPPEHIDRPVSNTRKEYVSENNLSNHPLTGLSLHQEFMMATHDKND